MFAKCQKKNHNKLVKIFSSSRDKRKACDSWKKSRDTGPCCDSLNEASVNVKILNTRSTPRGFW